MPKRVTGARIKKNRSYTIAEAAEALGVSIGTIRSYVRQGLPILSEKRPYLILGESLKTFLDHRNQTRRYNLKPNEVGCFSCKRPRVAEAGLVELKKDDWGRTRAYALCPKCGTTCCKTIGISDLQLWAALAKVD